MTAEPPTALPPIIKRSTSPGHVAVSNSALKSPVFSDPPSPGVHQGQTPAAAAAGGQQQPQGGYFSPQPSSILLNKGGPAPALPLPRPRSSTSRDRADDVSDRGSPGLTLRAPEARSPSLSGAASPGLLRIASPDGSAASDGGFSSDGGGGGGPGWVNGPPSTNLSTVGSPPTASSFTKPTLSTLYTGDGAGAHFSPEVAQADEAAQAALRRASSPPSPHCHFAPLPKPEDRPGTRRNSTANRVKPFVPPPRIGADSSPALDDDDQLHSPSGTYHPGDSSIPSASALSQRLSSSLTFADARSPSHSPLPTLGHPHGHGHGSASPSRPTSRRSSSSRRSRSPSPHAGRFRPSAQPSQGGVGAQGSGSVGASRSHSPNLSRHASTDALSLHYIEAAGEAAAVARERLALSRTSSRAGSERGGGGGGGVDWQLGGAGDDASGPFGQGPSASSRPGSRRTSTDRGVSLSRAGSSAGFVDRDKEADLHRLADKAAHGNVDAERAVSPALAAQAKRDRSASRGAQGGDESRATVIGRRGENEDVVEVGPGEDKDDNEGELEEVLEEPEEEEDDGDEEGGEDDEEEDEDDDEEDDGEGERSRGQDEDEDEDEDDEEPQEERKTSKGAAVEVVRWHRPERDQERDQQSSPALRGPSPAPSPGVSTPTTAAPLQGLAP
ncbi:hypothetical protein JCM3775_002340 [Rhodotorula graminis]